MNKEQLNTYSEKISLAHQHLLAAIPFPPEVGIILGTGLGGLLANISISMEVDYRDIPFFPVSTVESHAGTLVFGTLGNKKIVAMKGRFHYYEGYNMKEVTFPVRVMKKLGISHLFISNAAGGLHPDFKVGQSMIINDHIDLFPENPLRGANLEDFGPRFPDMSEPYDELLIQKALDIAKDENIHTAVGVYAGLQGPNLETKAEYKYLGKIGADAVGMSTVPEVIVARHMNLPVFAISAITDLCAPGKIKKITISEVLQAAAMAEPGMTTILRKLIESL
ncbi:purine-nucleoside phosphorylase [Pleomorphovibrio marinus]|uniref:purine-nucleoside phosphorylase n=1 Tax=Pleomorphovibrio marinus TaxID=2164132 RepID=UPI000E0AA493|nr:purine-nucleoside phosphorylase [Pleomorphovibrio marinus]